jgi:hypothetical protein
MDKVEVARSPRRRMAFNGTFETVIGRGGVAVRNISCTGAMIEGEDMPQPGRDIILRAAGMEFFGTVMWTEGRRCGVRFDEPLDMTEVLELHRITPQQVRSEELEAAARWMGSRHRFDY